MALQIVHSTLAIVTPANDGAEGKRQNTECQQGCTYVGNFREGNLGKCCAIGIGNVGVGQDAAYQYQSCKCTDYDGVPEGGCARHQGLAHGVACLGGCCHDGGTTQSALVTEQATGNTIAGGHHHCGAYKSATCSRWVESRIDNQLDGWPHIAVVNTKYGDAPQYIQQCHERYQHRTHLGNGFYTA